MKTNISTSVLLLYCLIFIHCRVIYSKKSKDQNSTVFRDSIRTQNTILYFINPMEQLSRILNSSTTSMISISSGMNTTISNNDSSNSSNKIIISSNNNNKNINSSNCKTNNNTSNQSTTNGNSDNNNNNNSSRSSSSNNNSTTNTFMSDEWQGHRERLFEQNSTVWYNTNSTINNNNNNNSNSSNISSSSSNNNNNINSSSNNDSNNNNHNKNLSDTLLGFVVNLEVVNSRQESNSSSNNNNHNNNSNDSSSNSSNNNDSSSNNNDSSSNNNDSSSNNYKNSSNRSALFPSLENCEIAQKYFNWNFDFKYSEDYLNEIICKCYATCNANNTDSLLVETIQGAMNDPLAAHNIGKFLSIMCSYSLMLLIGSFGNIATITGLVVWVKSKTPTIYFVLSLTTADLVLQLVCIPIKLAETLRMVENLESVTCKLMYYVRDFTFVSSIITMCIISLERYYAICHPLKAQYKCTKKRSIVFIVLIWSMSFILASPTIVAMKNYRPSTNDYIGYICRQNFSKTLHLYMFFTYYLGILFFLPLLVMVFAYSNSCYSLWQSAQKSQQMTDIQAVSATTVESVKNPKKGNDYKGRMKVIKMMIFLLVIFIICWGPSMIYRIIMIKSHAYQGILLQLFDGIVMLNSCVNPYIFMAMSSQFKKAVIRACTKRSRLLKSCCNIPNTMNKHQFKLSRDYSTEISVSNDCQSISTTISEMC